jgi:hypothetical protein
MVLEIVQPGALGGYSFSATEAAKWRIDPIDCLLASVVLSNSPSELDLVVLRAELRRRQVMRPGWSRLDSVGFESLPTGQLKIVDDYKHEVLADHLVAADLLHAIRWWTVDKVPVGSDEWLVTVPLSRDGMAIVLGSAEGDRGTLLIETPANLMRLLRVLESVVDTRTATAEPEITFVDETTGKPEQGD